jgi:hypothetical protein
LIGLDKAECVEPEGPWRGVDDPELATLNWVHWFNETRFHSSIGYVPPVENEAEYYRQINPRPQPRPGELTRHSTGDGSQCRTNCWLPLVERLVRAPASIHVDGKLLPFAGVVPWSDAVARH